MRKLPNSIMSRVYSFLSNNVHARRYEMRLPLRVSLLDSRRNAQRMNASSAMTGYLRDISKTGLSLLVPSLRFGDNFLVSGHYPLHVLVELPTGVVNIHIKPVRYDKVYEKQTDRKYLIGARIMKMTESDRLHLSQYMLEIRKSKAPSFSLAREAK
jgi:hypothetical protein